MHIGLLLNYISLFLIHEGGCDKKILTKPDPKNCTIISNSNNVTFDQTNLIWRTKYETMEDEIMSNNSDFGRSHPKESHVFVRSMETDNIDGQNITFRVINGQRAALGDVPWQVSLVKQREFTTTYVSFCGGVLIGPSKILSAAHCFDTNALSSCYLGELRSDDFKKTYAVMGVIETNVRVASLLSPASPYAQFRQLKHGSYPKSFKFPKDDIAVLHVSRSYVLNRYVQPVPYASVRKEYDGACLASGYGRINNYVQSPVLLLAYLQVIPTYICNKIHYKDMSRFVCTSDVTSDVHKGDSGGPLVCFNTGDPNEKNGLLVVGVVSGKNMARRFSTFFTRITSYYSLVSSSHFSLPSLFVTVIVFLLNCTFSLF